MATISANSGSYTIVGAASTTALALALAAGSYTITGTAATTRHGYQVVNTPGSYTITGTAIGVNRITAEPAAYQIQGKVATLRHSAMAKSIAASGGSYSTTGTVAILELAKPASVGTYTLTGTAALLNRSGQAGIAAVSGTYSITGSVAGLYSTVTIDSGEYVLTGTATTLRKGKGLVAASGLFVISGTPATLEQTRTFPAATGTYTLSGSITTLRYSNATTKLLVADSALYSLSGQAATVQLNRRVAANSGVYTLTGSEVPLAFFASSGVYVYTGTPATLAVLSHILTAVPGSYVITPSTTTLRGPGATLTANTGIYLIAGLDTQILISRPFAAGSGTYSIAGQASFLRVTHINLDPGIYVLTGTDAILSSTRSKRWRKHPRQPSIATRQPKRPSLWDTQPSELGLTQVLISAPDVILFVSTDGILTNLYDNFASLVFYLVSPDATSWRVTVDGVTGDIFVESGFTGSPVGYQLRDSNNVAWVFSVDNNGVLTLTS
jgi:hypothetical protein